MLKAKLALLSLSLITVVSMAAAGKPNTKAVTAKPVGNSGVSVAPKVPESKQPLDYAAVKSYYNDGDFQPAIGLLEEFQRTHTTFAREESLTVYKYLGVMYCADQGTREKGKSYFYKLLKIDPEARILDMYVSIVVQDIFKSTLDELMGSMGSGRSDRVSIQDPNPNGEKFPTPRTPAERQSNQPTVSEKKSYATYWWVGGLAVAAGVASGYYIYASPGSKGPDTNIPAKL